MSDVAAVDKYIFEYDEIWWLFTNIEPVPGGDYCSQLSIFYSDPLCGQVGGTSQKFDLCGFPPGHESGALI